jgi:ATP-binding protein involved in chromosome partitioning
MAPSERDVIEALRPVLDPELGVSIVELEMVRAVEIRRGRVTVTVALTVPGCPLREEITRRVSEAVGPLKGVREVSVSLTVMTPEQLDAVRRRVQANHGATHGGGGHGAGAGEAAREPDPGGRDHLR